MKPEDLLDKTKVYQFIKATESRNTIDKLSLPDDKKSLDKLLKSVAKWMNWHQSQRLEKPKSVGKK
jgi:hypothetical protein